MNDSRQPVTVNVMLRAEGLACRRGGRLLFESLDVRVAAGERLQVVGPNGCGKTSLLRILCGLRRPDAGRVLWRGTDIAHDDDGLREDLSFIGYQPGLKADLSPRENLGYAAALATRPRLGIDAALAAVGLGAQADVPCRRLSTGQLRRAALARLELLDTPLWILDEPLTGLDRAARDSFEQAMQRHAEAGGMVIFTTHQPLVQAGLRQLELRA